MDYKWYVVKTFSGHENKVKNLVEAGVKENDQLAAKIQQILVPTEKVFE
ncbi:MAG TPA: transcription termination/antitermination NusG family protein, partial [Ignavibacteriales bacterium]|nr:transcription termination/antitermination NusG family protein [Ignavibacteriales bacterium]